MTINNLSQAVATRRSTPFGEVRGTTGTWLSAMDKGFVGGTVDNTGLTHIGAREYDPATGRFISVDPLMDLADPQQMNGYAYANNGPVTYSDPTGLMRSGAQCGPDSMKCKGHIQDTIKTCCNAPYDPGPNTSVTVTTGIVKTKNSQTGQVWVNGYELPVNGPDPDRLIAGMIWYINGTGPQGYWQPDEDGQYDLIKTLHALIGACEGMSMNECGNDTLIKLIIHHDMVVTIEHGLEFGSTPPYTATGGKAHRYNEANLQTAGVPFCKNSFTGDTLVLMADGTAKRIDEIEVGDQVFATDPETGESGLRQVTKTIIGQGIKHLVEIEIEIAGGKIVATGLHPFWEAGDGRWVEAKDLRVGALLETSVGAKVEVTAIKERVEVRRVHNLTVDGIHTYYVLAGYTPVLVHNQNRVCGTAAVENGDIQHIRDRHRPGGKDVDDESGILLGKEKVMRKRIADVINRGRPTPNTPDPDTGRLRPGFVYEWDFGVPVGRSGKKNGSKELTAIRVIVDEGKVVTAFPI